MFLFGFYVIIAKVREAGSSAAAALLIVKLAGKVRVSPEARCSRLSSIAVNLFPAKLKRRDTFAKTKRFEHCVTLRIVWTGSAVKRYPLEPILFRNSFEDSTGKVVGRA